MKLKTIKFRASNLMQSRRRIRQKPRHMVITISATLTRRPGQPQIKTVGQTTPMLRRYRENRDPFAI